MWAYSNRKKEKLKEYLSTKKPLISPRASLISL
jgi:hypothetical protein